MSRYDSMCKAIVLIEAIIGAMSFSNASREDIINVKNDLQEIAKDVRYGGEWNGDYDTIARVLDCCSGKGISAIPACMICPYLKEKKTGNCARLVKSDGAAAIRQLSKQLQETEKKLELAERLLKEQDQEVKREVAPWQLEIMEKEEDGIPPEPADVFPWDDEPEMAPAEDGGVF